MLLDAFTGQNRLIVWFALKTGCRLGEVFALRVSDLDFDRRRVTISRALKSDGTIGKTKTGNTRVVPMTTTLADAIREHVKGKGPRDLVFTAERGGIVSDDNFRERVWKKAMHRLGWDGRVFYDCRHTFASTLIRKGADVMKVKAMMGHTKATTTLNVYGHLFDDHLDEVMALLDDDDEDAA